MKAIRIGDRVLYRGREAIVESFSGNLNDQRHPDHGVPCWNLRQGGGWIGHVPETWFSVIKEDRLTAAAPDLYQALKMMVASCDYGPDEHEGMRMALAALDKAEGET